MSKLHIDLLLALRGAGSFGITRDDLLTDMRRGRHPELTLPELDRALRDLADQSLAHPFTSTLGAKRWAITGRGSQALQEERL